MRSPSSLQRWAFLVVVLPAGCTLVAALVSACGSTVTTTHTSSSDASTPPPAPPPPPADAAPPYSGPLSPFVGTWSPTSLTGATTCDTGGPPTTPSVDPTARFVFTQIGSDRLQLLAADGCVSTYLIQERGAFLYPPDQHCYVSTILGTGDGTWSVNVFSLLDLPVDAGSGDAGDDGGVADAGAPALPKRMRWDDTGHVTLETNPPSNCDSQFVIQFSRD